MRFKQMAFGLALSLMVAGVANAGTTWMGFSGGAGIPSGDYGDVASTGWHIGATGTHRVNDTWGIGGDLGYHKWSGSSELNDAAEVEFGPGSEIKWNAIQATAHAVAHFATQSQAKPYTKAGLGVYRVTSKLESPSGDSDASKSKFGFNLGAGFDFPTRGKTRWGIDGAYHIISAKDDLGSDLKFFTVGVNVMWGVNR